MGAGLASLVTAPYHELTVFQIPYSKFAQDLLAILSPNLFHDCLRLSIRVPFLAFTYQKLCHGLMMIQGQRTLLHRARKT